MRKSYRRGKHTCTALVGIDLSVEAGEFLFLSGPSGGGKTTLLSIIGGLLRADAGSVRVRGKRVEALTQDQLVEYRRNEIGFVFQQFNLIRGLSALDNVMIPVLLQGSHHHKSVQERALELLQSVGLKGLEQKNPAAMSVGQCQRVAVARALMAEPNIILADEPTASLDSSSGMQSMELLKRLVREKATTCVVVTHDPRILCFADRVVNVEDGQLVHQSVPVPVDVPKPWQNTTVTTLEVRV